LSALRAGIALAMRKTAIRHDDDPERPIRPVGGRRAGKTVSAPKRRLRGSAPPPPGEDPAEVEAGALTGSTCSSFRPVRWTAVANLGAKTGLGQRSVTEVRRVLDWPSGAGGNVGQEGLEQRQAWPPSLPGAADDFVRSPGRFGYAPAVLVFVVDLQREVLVGADDGSRPPRWSLAGRVAGPAPGRGGAGTVVEPSPSTAKFCSGRRRARRSRSHPGWT